VKSRNWWSSCLVFLAWLPIALAESPATQSSAGPTDVFRGFLQDIQRGNSADLVGVCSARGEDAKGLVRDFQAVASAMQYLRTIVSAKFGPDAWAAVLPSLPMPADLDDVTETITGDQAQLTGANISKVRMIRVLGSWKLDVDGLLQSDEAPANIHWFSAMAEAMRRTADDVAAGRLTTAAAAAEAIAARVQAIPDVPTTQAATRP